MTHPTHGLDHNALEAALTRPIIGIENRTPQEAFDIMADRFRSFLASLPQQTAEPVIEAARELIASRSDTFRAGNNRRVGIQDQSGEKMWIVPFDEMAALERALEALND